MCQKQMIVLEIHRANPAPALPTNKNAPNGCEAFGAENETRTQKDLGTTVYMV